MLLLNSGRVALVARLCIQFSKTSTGAESMSPVSIRFVNLRKLVEQVNNPTHSNAKEGLCKKFAWTCMRVSSGVDHLFSSIAQNP